MKKKLLKVMTSLLLAASLLLSPGELPLSLNHSAHAAASVRIGNKSYAADTKVLNLKNMGLTDKDIKNIGSFTNLTELVISDNKITDLSPVSKLTTLKKITFHNNFVSDISFAKNLKKLTVFGAINNPISDISALSKLDKLKEVWMGDNLLTDISPLKNCKKLTHVSFNNCSLKNIEALRNKPLNTVCLENCGLKTIEPLSDCTTLEYVYLSYNKLTDISALSKSYNNLIDLYADVDYTAPAASSKPASSSKPSAPTASKESGTIYCVSDSAAVKLSAQSGATIYYSLNGGEYKKYSSKIKLTKSSTVKAYTKKDGKKSETVTFKYTLAPSTLAVGFKETDTADGKLVKITSDISGLKLYYTTDGSKPTTDSRLCPSGGITLTKSCKLRVLAVKSGWDSTSISKAYTVKSSSSNSGSSNNSGSSSSSSNSGSSGSSNGTSTNSTSKIITKGTETRECKACYSFGNCIECNGMGTVSRYPLGTVDCDRCKGTGKCYICNGTRKINVKANVVNEDAVPEGKEFRKCIQCQASGVCPYCNGGGVQFGKKCSMCEGTGICGTCDGSGGKLADKPAPSTDSSSSGGSSSGGSSGSSSSGNVSVLQNLCPTCRGTLQCNYCHGLRHCLTCSGKGGTYTSTYGHGTKWTPCTACGGSKKCKKCLGTGKCETCGGKPWTPQ